MPYCRECGKEVQNDWKTCPYCSCLVEETIEHKISVEDSVIMGNVGDTTNIHLAENKNIHNHMLTMIDAIREGRDERAKEIYEIAKKIDYSLAENLHDVEYNEQIIDAKVEALIKYWEMNLKGKAPESFDLDQYVLLIPFVKVVKNRALSIIEESPKEYPDVYEILGVIGIEYNGHTITNHEGVNLAKWAAKRLRKNGLEKEADALIRRLDRKLQEREKESKILVLALLGLGFIFLLMLN